MLRIKFTSGAGLVVLSGALGIGLASATLIAAEPKPEPKRADAKTLALGRELFEREWLPNDPRAHGGDGLGPVFNESSCVACHNQGGSGGGGAESKNVHLVTAINNGQQPQPAPQVVSEIERSRLGPALRGVMKALDSALLTGHQLRQQFDQERLQREQAEHFKKRVQQIHPGLATSRSLVLHRFGTDREYSKWRDQITGVAQNLGVMGEFGDPLDESAAAAKLAAPPTPEISVAQQAVAAISRLKEALSTSEPTAPEPTPQSFPNSMTERQIVLTTAQSFRFGGGQGQFENVSFVTSQRNSTSLFGAGLIDGIPDRVLDDAAKVTHPNFPEISGRVARMKDGKIGRFGWKSQKAHLYEFAMTACAVELGLQVPDHPQAALPHKRDYKPSGLDMNRNECDALVAFIQSLPAPRRTTIADPAVAGIMNAGEKLFTKVGCAACHTAKLGDVEGIYSDLLLHDLGPNLIDNNGGYGSGAPGLPSESDEPNELATNEFAQSAEFAQSQAQPGFSEISPLHPKRKSAAEFEWRTTAL